MEITIKNCNNIDCAKLKLEENKLNIKYAPNGTGKSTIAKAIIEATAEKDSRLEELLPFKYRKYNPDNIAPQVNGLDSITRVMCFSEDYMSRFVFQKDELLSNSFDIFIRTEKYRELETDIEELVSEVKKKFTDNAEIEELIVNLKDLSKPFTFTKTGISGSSVAGKALRSSNKLKFIPEGLEEYQPFIASKSVVNWIGWQKTGHEFLELSENCPFCVSSIKNKKKKIQLVTEEYDKNLIKNLQGIMDIIDRLGGHFSSQTKEKLEEVTSLREGPQSEHISLLRQVKEQIDNFVSKLEKLRELSAFDFEENVNVTEKLSSYELDLRYFDCIDSDKTKNAIEPINQAISVLKDKAGPLTGKIKQHQRETKRLIENHQTKINEFLAYAGYRYKVEIHGEGEEARLKLTHTDHCEFLQGGNQHLSYGERNAFAIVLFMYECLAKNPDLIILDDPISSFDTNKKFAIIEMLFGRDSSECLKTRTVLMLTHDIDPVVDMVRSLHKKFNNLVNASFLKLSNSIITEQEIRRDDFQTYNAICKEAIESDLDEIIKIIYLRRSFEIADRQGHAYQVLSNLLHKRDPLEDLRQLPVDAQYPEMESEDISVGTEQIRELLPEFCYTQILGRLNDMEELIDLFNESRNGYEKLQVFRLLELEDVNSVIQKFINETYHIENEYICQLNPAKFDTIPEYIIHECQNLVPKIALVK